MIDVHGQDALILTCGHIFRDSQGRGTIVVDLFAEGAASSVAGELIHYDLKRDLALVGVRTTARITPVPVAGPTSQIAPGQPLFSVGCNHGEDPTVMSGRLKAVNKYLGPENLTVEGRPVEGRSGGGLFSYQGVLLGVCNAADPEINEGLYAAFPSIHRHLDDCRLSFVYREPSVDSEQMAQSSGLGRSGQPPVSTPPLSPQPTVPTDRWSSVAQASTAGFPAQLTSGLSAAAANDAEVICIIRPRDEPASKSRVVVLDRPSREFLSQLNEERRAQGDRQMTQMRVAPSSSAVPAASASRPASSVRDASTGTVPRRLQRPVYR